MKDFSKSARAYLVATSVAGLVCLFFAFHTWTPGSWLKFAWYLGCAVLTSVPRSGRSRPHLSFVAVGGGLARLDRTNEALNVSGWLGPRLIERVWRTWSRS